MPAYSFKSHKLSEPERRWLKEAASSQPFDPRLARVKLVGILPRGFDSQTIDKKLLIDGQITPLGL